MRVGLFAELFLALMCWTVLGEDADHTKVDQVFAAYNHANSPGCAVGVIRNGQFVYRRGYGMGSIELGVPLSPPSVFYLGSVSKQFTAASVVLAAEQGYLSLDDDMRKYIPELPSYGHTITLRMLLHHTSGLRDFLSLLAFAGRDASEIHSDDELIDLIARQKGLNNVPGERFIYSNTNYFLLGVVVRRATGKSLAEFSAANIFRPLGMTQTRFFDDHSLVLPGRVAAYDQGSDGRILVDWSTQYDLVGGGGLTSSVNDLLAWDQNFYANRLGKGTLVKELQAPGTFNNGKPNSYALGLELSSYRGLPIVEHSGALYGYRTNILRFPEQRFTVLCLCNLSNANTAALSRQVAEVYLANSLKSEADAPDADGASALPDPSRFAGKYLDPGNHFVYTFSSSAGELMAWGAKLRRVGPNQFHDLGTGIITFSERSGNMTAKLAMDGENFFSGERVEPMHLDAAALAAYSGKYHSAEIDATYSLLVKNRDLLLQFKWDPALKLDPVAPDTFESGELGTLVFHRDAEGRITGFSIYEVSARGVAFERTE
jgi:CubicO group peptidase (beta-lactamase class C family)